MNLIGGRVQGLPVTQRALLDADADIVVGDSLASITPAVVGGELKALNIDPIRVSFSEWQALEASFVDLAMAVGAHYGPCATLNLDKEGRLFEIDIVKGDFSPLLEIPEDLQR